MSINNKVSDIIDNDNWNIGTSWLTQEEKINYIYSYIKKQERNAIIRRNIKLLFYMWIIIYFYIMIAVVLPRMIWDIIPWVDISGVTERFFWSDNSDSQNWDPVSEVLEDWQNGNF